MATLTVRNMEGKEAGTLELAAPIFESEINLNCVRAAVNEQLARRRQGNAAAKTRGQVAGSSRKPWRQKGTGRARAGSRKSPIWRGGGITFGPMQRSYAGRINRKVTKSALLSCLTAYAREKELVVLDSLDFPQIKTKQVTELLGKLQVKPCRVLFLTDTTNVNFALSARNIPYVDVINCDNLNVVDFTTHDVLVTTSAAIKRIEETYS